MELKVGMRLKDPGDVCHDGGEVVYEVVEDDGVLLLKCCRCGDQYEAIEFDMTSFVMV